MSEKNGVLTTALELLTFRISRDRILQFRRAHLCFGLLCTWIVGMGRYWDDPEAKLLQQTGIGSLIYVLLLSTMLWLIILPLRPKDWSFFHVLTFVTLTAPPAILYAIPVERFFSLPTARALNFWFLAIVAAWRVALLVFFLRRYGRQSAVSMIVAALLPLTMMVTALTALNLERAVFNIMGGLRGETEGTGNDTAYAFLWLLTMLSALLFIPLLLCYLVLVVNGFTERRTAKQVAKKKRR